MPKSTIKLEDYKYGLCDQFDDAMWNEAHAEYDRRVARQRTRDVPTSVLHTGNEKSLMAKVATTRRQEDIDAERHVGGHAKRPLPSLRPRT